MLLPGLLLGMNYTAALVAALLASGALWRRVAAVLVAAAALPVTFLAPAEDRGLRAILALGSLWFMARVVELARKPTRLPAAHRMWHAVGIVDTRRVRRGAPALDASALRRLVVAVPVVAVAWAGVYHGGALLSGLPPLAVRWLGGAVLMYAAVEAAVALLLLLYGALGVDPRPLHEDPICSRSIAEFWSRRWNRIVHRFLKQNVFAPVARRGHPQWGMVLAFLVSAFLHFAFILPAVGLFWAGMMGAFFLLQLPFLWAERVLGVARWPAPLARAWTLVLLLGSSPLFVEPMLQIVDSWN